MYKHELFCDIREEIEKNNVNDYILMTALSIVTERFEKRLDVYANVELEGNHNGLLKKEVIEHLVNDITADLLLDAGYKPRKYK